MLAGEPVDAKRGSGWYVLRKAAYQNRSLIGGLAALVVLAAVVAIGTVVLTVRERAASSRLKQEQEQAFAESRRTLAASKLLRRVFWTINAEVDAKGRLAIDHALQRVQSERELGGQEQSTPGDPFLMSLLAQVWLDQGDATSADATLREARMLQSQTALSDRAAAADLSHGLAVVMLKRNRLGDAEAECRKAMAQRIEVFGLDHPMVARSRALLAAIQLEKGRSVDALDECLRAIEVQRRDIAANIQRRDITTDIEALGASVETLAAIAERQGWKCESLRAARESLVLRLSVEGDTDPEVVAAVARYAAALEAAGTGEQVHQERKAAECLGVAPDALPSLLGEVASRLGQPSVSAQSGGYWQARLDMVGIRRVFLDGKTLPLARSLAMLGSDLTNTDQAEYAIAPLQEAIQLFTTELNGQHQSVLNCRFLLCDAYRQVGEYKLAVMERLRGLEIMDTRPAEQKDALSTLNVRAALGRLYGEGGNHKEAERLARLCMNEAERCFGADHVLYVLSLRDCAWAVMKQGRIRDAEPLAREAFERYRRDAEGLAAHRLTFQQVLGVVECRAGRYAEAREVMEVLRAQDGALNIGDPYRFEAAWSFIEIACRQHDTALLQSAGHAFLQAAADAQKQWKRRADFRAGIRD